MGSITTQMARGEFTKKVIDVYKEKPVVTSFLRSFFPEKTSVTKTVSIEVQRGTEKVAVDVARARKVTSISSGCPRKRFSSRPITGSISS